MRLVKNDFIALRERLIEARVRVDKLMESPANGS
jgi:hypothetical protein